MNTIETIRAEIERRINALPEDWIGAPAVYEEYQSFLSYLDTLPEQPELVQHPAISYMYDADADRDEQLRQALLALLKSDLIQVAGRGFTKQDLIGWVEKK